jgi:hypothetical protein
LKYYAGTPGAETPRGATGDKPNKKVTRAA